MDTLGKIIEDYIERQLEKQRNEDIEKIMEFLEDIKQAITKNQKGEFYEIDRLTVGRISFQISALKNYLKERQ